MKDRIHKIYFDWRQVGSIHDKDGCGEDYDLYTVGINGVEEIKEHLPMGEGDRLYYDIIINGKMFTRLFNPNQVIYFT